VARCIRRQVTEDRSYTAGRSSFKVAKIAGHAASAFTVALAEIQSMY